MSPVIQLLVFKYIDAGRIINILILNLQDRLLFITPQVLNSKS